MRVSYSYLAVIGLAVFSAACGKDDSGGGSGSGSGNVNIAVKSSAFSALARSKAKYSALSTNCSVQNGAATGKCYTPTRVAGNFNMASLGSTYGGVPVRLLGGGEKYHGLDDVFRTAPFDLSESVFIDGDDNIQDGGGGPYNMVTLHAQALETQFLAAGKYFTVRLFFVGQPPSSESVFSSCGLDSGTLEGMDEKGVLYSGMPSGIQAGDILVCIKDTQGAICADSDFQWVNDSSGYALSSTRPSTPVRLTGSYFQSLSNQCSQGSEHPDLTWGGTDLYASLATPISVSASFSEGTKIYTSGSASGSTLDVTVDLNVENSIFVPSSAIASFESTDYATDGPTVRGNLDQILLKQVYEYNARSSSSQVIESMLSATVSLAISDTSEASDGDVENP